MSHTSDGSHMVLTASTELQPTTPTATPSTSEGTILSDSSHSPTNLVTSSMDSATATSVLPSVPPSEQPSVLPSVSPSLATGDALDRDVFPLLSLPEHVMTCVLAVAWNTLDGPGRRALRLSNSTVCTCVDRLVTTVRLNVPQHFPHVMICSQPVSAGSSAGACDAELSANQAVQEAAQQLPASHQLDFTQPDDGWGVEFTEEGEPDEYLPGSDAADYTGMPAANAQPQATAAAGPSTSGSTLNDGAGASGSTSNDGAGASGSTPVSAHSTSGALPDSTPHNIYPDADRPAQLDEASRLQSTTCKGRDAAELPKPRLCDSCLRALSRASQRFPNLVHLEISTGEAETFVSGRLFLRAILPGWSSIKELSLKPGSQITFVEEDIQLLGDVCPQLEKLYLPPPVNREALSRIPPALPKLNTLYFGNFWQAPAIGVLSQLVNLTRLQIRAVVVAAVSMHGLSSLTSLRELRLGPVYHMTPAELASIASLPALRRLHLWAMFGVNPDHDENGLSNPDLEQFFSRLSKLEALSLHNFPGGQADDGLLRVLGKMPQLKALRIDSKARVAEAPHPDAFPVLTKLHVGGGDELELKLLKGLGLGVMKQQLQEVVLDSGKSDMADKVVKMLVKQVHLRRIVLRCVNGWALTRLKELSCLPELESLSIVVNSDNMRPKADSMDELRRSLTGVKVTVSVNPVQDLVRFDDDLLPE